ncbi:MAG: hypothetical protein WCA19_18585 [Candidatus Acidiferrales bacterium]
MTFSTILVILLGFQTPSTIPLSQFQMTLVSPNTVADRMVAANEFFTDRQNSERSPSLAFWKHAKQDAKTQTLTGIVEWEYKPLAWDCDVPNCDHFALYDDATHLNYELDDARAALPFEGKRAKVTGVVNTKDSIIHVISIEAVK